MRALALSRVEVSMVPSQLRAAPARAAPYATPSPGADRRTDNGRSSSEDARERVAASAVLIDGGRRALTVDIDGAGVADAAASGAIRVRNGFGQTVTAQIERRIPALGVTVLILDQPMALPAGSGLTAQRDPFPGSPAVAVHYVKGADASAAWPWARQGFLGRPLAARPYGRPCSVR
jgi:hypothetical protein